MAVCVVCVLILSSTSCTCTNVPVSANEVTGKAPPTTAPASVSSSNSGPVSVLIPAPSDTTEEETGEYISVSSFIKRSLEGKYSLGEAVFVSGIIIEVGSEFFPAQGKSFRFIILGPAEKGYTVKIRSEGCVILGDGDKGFKSYSSLLELEVGDSVVIEGKYYGPSLKKFIVVEHSTAAK